MLSVQYRSAEQLERYLGDPREPRGPFAYRRAVELDEADAFPVEACAALDSWGFPAAYVPLAEGGQLAGLDACGMLWRVIARRDLTATIGHAKTFLGAIPIWAAGTAAQRQRMGALVLGGSPVALALTERSHGSDLTATAVRATQDRGGYRLTGEKWLINNATRGAAFSLLARTDPAGGPRGHSIFFVEKARISRVRYRYLPKVRTHGIRGADISGIRFDNCALEPDSLVGAPGSGLELTLKILQVTRTMCAALSLGAADTALRLTLDFALGRQLYGAPLIELPQVRRTLSDAFVDLLIADCVALGTARAVSTLPAQLSHWSAIAKFFVPTQVDALFRRLAVVLGARYYLREAHYEGVFQKFLRDNAIIGLFDGNTVVNLQAIVQQLPLLLKPRRSASQPAAELARDLHRTYALDIPAPPWDLQLLGLSSRGQDAAVQGLALMPERLGALQDAELASTLQGCVAGLEAAGLELAEEQRALEASAQGRPGQAPESFDLAERYCLLHSAAAALQLWWANRAADEPFLAEGSWLALGLERLLARLRPGQPSPLRPADRERWRETVVAELCARLDQGRLFAVVPLHLAGRGRS